MSGKQVREVNAEESVLFKVPEAPFGARVSARQCPAPLTCVCPLCYQ
jgi:hypothetical protein